MFGDCSDCDKFQLVINELLEDKNMLKDHLFKLKKEIQDVSGLIKSYLQLKSDFEKVSSEHIQLKSKSICDNSEEVKYLKYELSIAKKKNEQISDSLNNLGLLNSQLIAENEKLQLRLNKESEQNEINKFKREIIEKEKVLNKQNMIITQLKNDANAKLESGKSQVNLSNCNNLNEDDYQSSFMKKGNLPNDNLSDLSRAIKEIDYLQAKNLIYKNKYKKFKAKHTTTSSILEMILQRGSAFTYGVNDRLTESNYDLINRRERMFVEVAADHSDALQELDAIGDQSKKTNISKDKLLGKKREGSVQLEEEFMKPEPISNSKCQKTELVVAVKSDETEKDKQQAPPENDAVNPLLLFKNNNLLIKEKLKTSHDNPFINQEVPDYIAKLRSAKRRLDEEEKKNKIEEYKQSKMKRTKKSTKKEIDDDMPIATEASNPKPTKKGKANVELIKTESSIAAAYVPPPKRETLEIFKLETVKVKKEFYVLINEGIDISELFDMQETQYEKVLKVFESTYEQTSQFIPEKLITFYSKFVSEENSQLILDYFSINFIRFLSFTQNYDKEATNFNQSKFKINFNSTGLTIDLNNLKILNLKEILTLYWSVLIILSSIQKDENNLLSNIFQFVKYRDFSTKLISMFEMIILIVKNNDIKQSVINSKFKEHDHSDLRLFGLKKYTFLASSDVRGLIVNCITQSPQNVDESEDQYDKLYTEFTDLIDSKLKDIPSVSLNLGVAYHKSSLDISGSNTVLEIYQMILLSLKFLPPKQLSRIVLDFFMNQFVKCEDKSSKRALVIYFISEISLMLNEKDACNQEMVLVNQKISDWLFSIFNPKSAEIKSRLSDYDRLISSIPCIETYGSESILPDDFLDLLSQVNMEVFDKDYIKKLTQLQKNSKKK